jgi:hypothetical protein
MWTYYDWVVVVFRLLTDDNDNSIIIRPHIVFTDERQQRKPNHNTTTYCVSLFSSVSKHNMWSCYDWVVVVVFRRLTQHVVILWLGCSCCRPSVNTICGRIMIGLSFSSVSKRNMWSDHIVCLLTDDNNNNPIIIRPHIVFTDGRQRQPNHNTTTYCVYWPTTMTTYYDWVVIVFLQ